MSKKIKYVFLLLSLFLSVLFFASGVYTVSYADERIDNKQILKEDFEEVTIRLQDLNKNTKNTSDFSNYYNNWQGINLKGNFFELTTANITTSQELFQKMTNLLNTTFIGGTTYTIQLDNVTILMNYYNNNNVLTTIGHISSFYYFKSVSKDDSFGYVLTNNNRFNILSFNSDGSLWINYTNKYKLYIDNSDNTITNNRLFTINDNTNNTSILSMIIPEIEEENNILTITNLYNMYYSSNNSIITNCNILIENRTTNNGNYPTDITIINYETINLTITNNIITIELTQLIQDYGYDYILKLQINTSYIFDNINYSLSTLPYLYDFGAIPDVPLSAPVISVSNNILTWSSVANADYYIIKRVSDNQIYYVNNYTSLSYVLSVNGSYSVQACSNQSGFLNSDYSNVIIITSFADTQYSFLLLMSAIMDSILMLFKSFLNYEIFGVNMFSAFGVILFICLILALLRVIRGNK